MTSFVLIKLSGLLILLMVVAQICSEFIDNGTVQFLSLLTWGVLWLFSSVYVVIGLLISFRKRWRYWLPGSTLLLGFLLLNSFVNPKSVVRYTEPEMLFSGDCEHTMSYVGLNLSQTDRQAYINSLPYTYASRQYGTWWITSDTLHVEICGAEKQTSYKLVLDSHGLRASADSTGQHGHYFRGNVAQLNTQLRQTQ